MRKLEELQFSNSFSAKLPSAFYARVDATPLESPFLVSFNPEAADLIELHHEEHRRPEFVEVFNGDRYLDGSDPIAMLYAGHQFGQWVPQLGDGRALLLGEVTNSRGERWELQLKGAGQTPFSRRGDGRAVLRSSIREYLCSEAMHALGIPTTRALCLIGSNEEVYRESIETGAMVLRMAPSHVRFGSFEVFYYRGQYEQIRELADWVIEHHYPELLEREDRYLAFYRKVIDRTAKLMAQWQLVGFNHGVMNTDNFSVLGITLDYGPFGFMERFDRGYICNHSDYGGRYAFDQQPEIGLWNLSCLGQALLPLLDDDSKTAADIAVGAFRKYQPQFVRHYAEGMSAKLGLGEYREGDGELINDTLDLLQKHNLDYTRFFRALCDFDRSEGALNSPIRDTFIDRSAFDKWAARYAERLRTEGRSDAERGTAMKQVNPKYILRNYLAQIAIDRAQQGDYSEVEKLLAILRRPFDEQPEHEAYAAEPPDWGRELEVSCSS